MTIRNQTNFGYLNQISIVGYDSLEAFCDAHANRTQRAKIASVSIIGTLRVFQAIATEVALPGILELVLIQTTTEPSWQGTPYADEASILVNTNVAEGLLVKRKRLHLFPDFMDVDDTYRNWYFRFRWDIARPKGAKVTWGDQEDLPSGQPKTYFGLLSAFSDAAAAGVIVYADLWAGQEIRYTNEENQKVL